MAFLLVDRETEASVIGMAAIIYLFSFRKSQRLGLVINCSKTGYVYQQMKGLLSLWTEISFI